MLLAPDLPGTILTVGPAPCAHIWTLHPPADSSSQPPTCCTEAHSPLHGAASFVAFDAPSRLLLWGTKRGGLAVCALPSLTVLASRARVHGTKEVSWVGVQGGELVSGGHDGCVRRCRYHDTAMCLRS